MAPGDDQRRSIRRIALVAAALVLGGVPRGPAGAADDHPSPAAMVKRWQAGVASDDAAGFDRVIAEYRRPGLDESLRGLLVSTVCDAVHSDPARARLKAWREQDAAQKDAWLWYRSLLDDVTRDPASARAVVASDLCPVVRAAAVHALAASADPETLAALPAAVAAIAETGTRRALLLEAWAAVVAGQPGRSGTPEFAAAVEALLPLFADEGVEPRTRLAVARALRLAFEVDDVSVDPRTWRSLLARVDAPRDPTAVGPTRSSRMRFFDVDATGNRVVYVVDVSDSMEAELSAAERSALRAMAPPEAPGAGADKNGIAWKGVRTRLEAVAEFTKLSIRGLPEDAAFCVVLFGSQARTLESTPALVPATPANVAAAARDLDAFQRRGKGLGSTNLHAALRHAFAATVGGRDTKPERLADALALAEQGATTIFVLSDGEPTRDPWDDTVKVVDATPIFAGAEPLTEDVERMNLFQGAEIHTIAFGYTDDALLPRLAREGGGHCRTIGVAPPAAPALRVPHVPATASGRELLQFLRGLADPAADPGRLPVDPLVALRRRLATTTSIDEKVVLAHGLAERGDRAVVPVLLEGLTASTLDVARDADDGLALLAKRSFGGVPSPLLHERWALRRNWTWWWAKQPK